MNYEAEEGYTKVGAKKIMVHPDWKPFDSKYDADIAIIVLQIAVQYTKYIRPLCLWTGTSFDIRDIEDKNGVVVGWGTNQEVISICIPFDFKLLSFQI